MAETPLKRSWAAPRAVARFRATVASEGLWLCVAPALWPLLVLGVVLLGASFRFRGLDWDQPAGAPEPLQMQPDERFISIVAEKLAWPSSLGEYFATARSPLNPYNAPETPSFVYGTFPLFLAKGVASIAGSDAPVVGPAARQLCEKDSYGTTVVCGRKLTALFDTATIALVFALGALLFSRRVGLATALLYALSVLPTQLSHFWAVDPYAVFFGVATAALSVKLIGVGMRPRSEPLFEELFPGAPHARSGRSGGYGRAALVATAMGVCVGLGLASKVTAWPILLAPALAVAIRIGLRDLPRLGLNWRDGQPSLEGHWANDVAILCVSMLVALVVFRVVQPYAFTGPNPWDMAINPQWRADIEREVNFQNGNVDFPPFVQFAGRTPWLWPFKNMVLFGLGPALGLGAWAAFVAATAFLFRRRELTFLIPLVLVAAVFGFQGPRFVAYMRYFVPMYPYLCLFAAWGLAGVWSLAREAPGPRRTLAAAPARARFSAEVSRRYGLVREATAPGTPVFRFGLRALVIAVFAATAWWALAFQSIYSHEHPRIAASRWVFANVEPGKRLTGETWDDTIPYAIPGEDAGRYPVINTFPFDSDSPTKVNVLVYGRGGADATAGLVGADYVSIASNRARDAVRRLEREYPATIRYYQLLDSGELGFDLVARFRVRPTFLGVSVDDSGAEESFTVYDHPEVRIYRKTERFDPEKAVSLLNEAHPERAVNLLPRQGRTNGLQFTAAEARTQQTGGTFADLFDEHGLTSHLPWLWWLVWVQLMALAAVPWVTWLFRALPDRGYGLSKIGGFALSGLLTWLAVAWGTSHYTTALIWGVFFALAISGYGLAYLRRRQLAADLRDCWRSWLAVEAVFLVAFFVVLALRYNNPALWHNAQGGEKPVELAYLTAVARSTSLPPYDPWFSGGAMNYYYMGWFLVTVPMRAFRMLPEVGFNLALPTYAALAATVAYSVVANLVALGMRARRAADVAVGAAAGVAVGSHTRVILFGALAAILLVGIGNLDGAHQTVERLQTLNQWGFLRDSGDGRDLFHPWNIVIRILSGGVGIAGGLYQWIFKGAVMPPFDWWRSSRVHYPAFDITEFPYWSFLFGDLHAHVMGLPFFGFVIALAMTYVVSASQGMRRHTWVLGAALGVAVGLVRTIHTWDFPSATLLAVSAIVAGQFLAEGRWQRRWWDAVGQLTLFGACALLLFSPYTQHTEVFESGIVRARETTAVNQYFTHFGLFVVVGLIFLGVRYREELRARSGDPRGNPFLSMVAGPWEVLSLCTFAAGLAAFSWQWGLTTAALSALVLLLLLNLLWLEFRAQTHDVPRLIATAMFTAAVGIAGGVDIVQAKYDIVRMNTVFKFSLEAWQLYALASAYALWYVAETLWAIEGFTLRVRSGRRLAAIAFAVVIGGLLFGSSIYLWSGTRTRQEAAFAGAPSGTLNGLAYLRVAQYPEDKGTELPADDRVISLADDEPLIRWLRRNVEGSPVIVEAVGPLYHWTGRISWNTGLPAVIGWDWHEVAYRTDYEPLIQERRRDTTRFWVDPSADWAAGYLQKYNVKYVVLGTEERVYGTPDGLAKFERMPELREVFRSGDYAIYEVMN